MRPLDIRESGTAAVCTISVQEAAGIALSQPGKDGAAFRISIGSNGEANP
jgi:hypothetical protein